MSTLSELYKSDFHAWALQAGALLRQHRFAELNIEELAEEVEDLAAREYNELEGHLVILLAHFLQLQFEPQLPSTSPWKFESSHSRSRIMEQRVWIQGQLRFSPSIAEYFSQAIAGAYTDAVELAADFTVLPKQTFPVQCPYTQEQILDKTYYPQI